MKKDLCFISYLAEEQEPQGIYLFIFFLAFLHTVEHTLEHVRTVPVRPVYGRYYTIPQIQL